MNRYIDNSEKVILAELQNSDDVMFDLNGERFVMSYDAFYDLTLRMGYLAQKMADNPECSCLKTLN